MLFRAIEEGEAHDVCVEALGFTGSPRAYAVLVEKLSSESEGMRFHAARGLGHLRDERGVPFLVRRLDDSSSLVVSGAVRALREIANERPDDTVTPEVIAAVRAWAAAQK